MSDVTLVYPHQLFLISKSAALEHDRPVVLIEEPLFFTQFRFHKQKLMLHRASMKAYEAYLKEHDFEVTYLEVVDCTNTTDVLRQVMDHFNPEAVHMVEPDDYLLNKRLDQWGSESEVKITRHESPLFLTPKAELEAFFTDGETFRMAGFYKQQRRRMNILVDDNGNPTGGQWSFDEDNREPYDPELDVPAWPPANQSDWIKEARDYVETHFSDHYGDTENFPYPVTRSQALEWFERFLQQRFGQFGPYEDAFSKDDDSFLFHSVLTPFLNTGLMTPDEVVEKALSYAKNNDVLLNSLEGFIRQIIGWREFMHGLYVNHGSHIRTQNFFNHQRALPEAFWQADTGVPPVDHVIEKILSTGYAHHIERLMVLANFMTLCEINPHHVYGWFMEVSIDAYDWVMVPNFYSMGVFADGGVMATKPYVSSSNYICKMSDWKRDKDNEEHWSYLWDGLYWRFMHEHRDFFESNARLARLTSYLDRMSEKRWEGYQNTAAAYLAKLTKEAARFDDEEIFESDR